MAKPEPVGLESQGLFGLRVFRVSGLGFWGLVFRGLGVLGFRGLGFRVWGFGVCRTFGLGLRVEGGLSEGCPRACHLSHISLAAHSNGSEDPKDGSVF